MSGVDIIALVSLSVGGAMILSVLIFSSLKKNSSPKKDRAGQFWAVSYYSIGPKRTEHIGLTCVHGISKEVAEVTACLNVAMKNPGSYIVETVVGPAGMYWIKEHPADPSWKDMIEGVKNEN